MTNGAWYELKSAGALLTPCLLVFPAIIRQNLQESIRIARGVDRLRLHVKTHKTPQIVKLALEAGVTKHKCATLMEAAMLAECGAPDVLIAYPIVGPAIAKLKQLCESFPRTQFRCTVDNKDSLDQLAAVFSNSGQSIDVLVDLDTGMHRTGITPGEAAIELYAKIASCQEAATGVTAGGLHVYDGQNHQHDEQQRREAVDALMVPVRQMVRGVRDLGFDVPRLVCGGTPTFPMYAALNDDGIECSPGTCTLSDYNYGKNYSDMACIKHAAVLVARVISKCGDDRVTIDLGYKAVSGDQPVGRRCHVLNIPDAKEVGHSEEHLILESKSMHSIVVGDVVYALPAHVCPTVALHSHLQVIEDGIVVDRWEVTARNRFY